MEFVVSFFRFRLRVACVVAVISCFCILSLCKSMSMFTVVSTTFSCRATLYASERAISGHQCPIRSGFTKWKYQRLSYVLNVLVPLRYQFDKP
jgi:hypothetical protein